MFLSMKSLLKIPILGSATGVFTDASGTVSLPGVFPGLEIVLISGPFLVRVALPHSDRG